MEYVKMPELLSEDVVNALSGNLGEIRSMMEADADSPCGSKNKDNDICCPKKVKFILFLNNVVIINVNAVAEEEEKKHHRPE